jgi:hypothetical protein
MRYRVQDGRLLVHQVQHEDEGVGKTVQFSLGIRLSRLDHQSLSFREGHRRGVIAKVEKELTEWANGPGTADASGFECLERCLRQCNDELMHTRRIGGLLRQGREVVLQPVVQIARR